MHHQRVHAPLLIQDLLLLIKGKMPYSNHVASHIVHIDNHDNAKLMPQDHWPPCIFSIFLHEIEEWCVRPNKRGMAENHLIFPRQKHIQSIVGPFRNTVVEICDGICLPAEAGAGSKLGSPLVLEQFPFEQLSDPFPAPKHMNVAVPDHILQAVHFFF